MGVASAVAGTGVPADRILSVERGIYQNGQEFWMPLLLDSKPDHDAVVRRADEIRFAAPNVSDAIFSRLLRPPPGNTPQDTDVRLCAYARFRTRADRSYRQPANSGGRATISHELRLFVRISCKLTSIVLIATGSDCHGTAHCFCPSLPASRQRREFGLRYYPEAQFWTGSTVL